MGKASNFFGGDHGGEGAGGKYRFFGGEHGGGGGDGMYFILAGSTAAEAGTACILFWQGGRILFLVVERQRLNGIDDEIYERADFRSALSIATATTTATFRRDLL